MNDEIDEPSVRSIQIRSHTTVNAPLKRLCAMQQYNHIHPEWMANGLTTWADVGYNRFITEDGMMKAMLNDALEFATCDGAPTVLIQGPTGTGKEILALMMHKDLTLMNFIAVNLTAVPENLFESVLFGHKKGSFTGAQDDYPGYFGLARDGTLFLDEIGSVPIASQSKLLRAIETRSFWPIGAKQPETTNARFVCATKYDLEEQVEKGLFLEDLYARLFTCELTTTAIAKRPVDVAVILDYYGCDAPYPDTGYWIDCLRKYNVRALKKYAYLKSLFGTPSLVKNEPHNY
jgi:transcriptional regulator with PAS, ATPase and Fis domain